jgi:hypothetical protein
MLAGAFLVPSLRPDAADACDAIASNGMWFAVLLTKNEIPDHYHAGDYATKNHSN